MTAPNINLHFTSVFFEIRKRWAFFQNLVYLQIRVEKTKINAEQSQKLT